MSSTEQIKANGKARQVRKNIEVAKVQSKKPKRLLALPGKINISDVTSELEEMKLDESNMRFDLTQSTRKTGSKYETT